MEKQNAAQPETAPNLQAKQVKLQGKQVWATRWSAAVATLALIAASTSAYFVWLNLTKTSANFLADKRPWVALRLPEDDEGIKRMVTFPQGEEGEAAWHVDWRNFGSSPAVNVRVKSTVIVSHDKGGKPMELEDVDWPRLNSLFDSVLLPTSSSDSIAIMPGQEMPQSDRSQHVISPETVQLIQQQKSF